MRPFTLFELIMNSPGGPHNPALFVKSNTYDHCSNRVFGFSCFLGSHLHPQNWSNTSLAPVLLNDLGVGDYQGFRVFFPQRVYVTLRVPDVLSREIQTLPDGELPEGSHSVIFDGENLSHGVYSHRLTAGQPSQTRKALLVE